MRNILNLSQHAAAGLRSSRTTARTGTVFTTTSRSSSSCTARSTRICSRSTISRSIRCISSALSPLRRSAACGILHSAGFHRIFLSTLRRRITLSVRSPSFSCGASAVFYAKNPALRASIANVKINLSPLDLIHSDGGSHLIRILDEYGLPYSCFQFEITETVATEYSASLTRVAERVSGRPAIGSVSG